MNATFSTEGYQALVEAIFRRFPSVQKEGFTLGAYKPGLERMRAFDAALGYPSRQLHALHIAGTNGKGSVANLLASALTSCGIKTGLFTSPHLVDFRERMRVGGALIPREYVFAFLTQWLPWCAEHDLSFFEITTGLAFRWFADQGVQAAVIETGLGGRLDSTNILERPLLTVITSIGLDHCALLGNTLAEIAAEKAGIFKPGVPALIGERQAETEPVFAARTAATPCPLHYAQNPSLWPRRREILAAMDLQAAVQERNLCTVLCAVDLLRAYFPALEQTEALVEGIEHAARNMGFHGRWERLRERPLVIADIGHNAHALRHNFAQLEALPARPLVIVYGIMADKDLDAIFPLMPRGARYLFTTPDTPRALPAAEIFRRFRAAGRTEEAVEVPTVAQALENALALAGENGAVYVGGSTFVVADALKAGTIIETSLPDYSL